MGDNNGRMSERGIYIIKIYYFGILPISSYLLNPINSYIFSLQ